MNARTLGLAVALFAIGFAAGAWWMDARRAAEIAELEAAASRSMVADLAALSGAVPGPALPTDQTAAAAAPLHPQVPGAGAPTPLGRPADAAPSPVAAAVGRLMPEPPASWMSVEQQRAAAAEYREWVREEGRLAGERARGLNAELFMIEGQDPTWGAAIESKVRAALATDAVFAGIELEGMECRVTVCRAVLRFPEADSPQGLPNGGRSIWSAWRGAQIIPNRAEINDGVPGFRVTVFLGDDFDRSQVTPRDPRNRGPGGP